MAVPVLTNTNSIIFPFSLLFEIVNPVLPSAAWNVVCFIGICIRHYNTTYGRKLKCLSYTKNHTLYCRSTNIWNIHILQVMHVNQLSCNCCIVCMNLSIIHVTRFNEALVKATYDHWKNIARIWRTYILLLALHITWPQMARRSVIDGFSAVDICNTEIAYFS